MTPSHKMERQLKALIWQRLAGMFLIDGLHHKLVSTAACTLQSAAQQAMYGCNRENDTLVCTCKVFAHVMWVQLAEGSDGNGQTQTLTATLGIQASTSLFTAANWPKLFGRRQRAEIPQNKTKKVHGVLAHSSTSANLAVMNLTPHRGTEAHGHDSLNVPPALTLCGRLWAKVTPFKCG